MKLLFLDIETAPVLAYSWGDKLYEQDLLEIVDDWFVLGIGWKWNHLNAVHWRGMNEYKGYAKDKKNDYHVVKQAWDLLDEAHVVIAHNGISFDIKKLNTRFLLHGFKPPSPYLVLDTKRIAKKNFAFTSNKLDELSRQIDKDRKLTHTGKKLWFDCMAGDKKAWDIMGKYCKQDVILLKKKYQTFLPWIDNHPNWNLDGDRPECCPKCGSGRIIQRGSGFTRTTEFQRYSCKACGGWFRGKHIRNVALR